LARLGLVRQLAATAETIKLAHSVFALPFAVAATALAAAGADDWSWWTLLWIVACAVTARTAAMAQNRLADAAFDAENPRTAARALPAGRVTPAFVRGVVAVSSAAFVLSAAQLNRLCLLLSPVVLAVLLLYPYAKRFTSLAHFWLGAALGLAPVGAWIAVRGAFAEMAVPLFLGVAVMLWTAGFDLIYACQDVEVDRRLGLRSLPARIGVARALRLARRLHAACLACLVAALLAEPRLGWIFGTGLAAAAAIFAYEHSIVGPNDLSRVDLAFFTLNGCVSLVVGGAAVLDALLG
jgi:4-hydroxybenzoate polyprenyltransferase